MKLILDDNFYIEGDLNSFILHYHSPSGGFNSKGKEVISKDEWNYPTIALCLISYLSRVVATTESILAGEILTKYNEIQKQIMLLKELTWNNLNEEIVKLKEENQNLKNQLKRKK